MKNILTEWKRFLVESYEEPTQEDFRLLSINFKKIDEEASENKISGADVRMIKALLVGLFYNNKSLDPESFSIDIDAIRKIVTNPTLNRYTEIQNYVEKRHHFRLEDRFLRGQDELRRKADESEKVRIAAIVAARANRKGKKLKIAASPAGRSKPQVIPPQPYIMAFLFPKYWGTFAGMCGVAHAGMALIETNGTVTIAEFGRYDPKLYKKKSQGIIKKTVLPHVAKFDSQGYIKNPRDLAALVRSRTASQEHHGDEFEVAIIEIEEENVNAVKQHINRSGGLEYNLVDPTSGGGMNCSSFTYDAVRKATKENLPGFDGLVNIFPGSSFDSLRRIAEEVFTLPGVKDSQT